MNFRFFSDQKATLVNSSNSNNNNVPINNLSSQQKLNNANATTTTISQSSNQSTVSSTPISSVPSSASGAAVAQQSQPQQIVQQPPQQQATQSITKKRSVRRSNERYPKLTILNIEDNSVEMEMEVLPKSVTFKFNVYEVDPIAMANDFVSSFACDSVEIQLIFPFHILLG